jgi:hypothetical protein
VFFPGQDAPLSRISVAETMVEAVAAGLAISTGIVPAGLMRAQGSTHSAGIPAGMRESRPWMARWQAPPT